jgi:hypothetical protein
MYQNLRMPRIGNRDTKLNLKYNIAEYLFYLGSNKKVKLERCENSIQTVNTKNYGDNYWEFTKKKIIWARKSDKIKNEIDYENRILEKTRKMEKDKFHETDDLEPEKYKIQMFDKLHSFNKYDSLETKRR